MNDINIIYVILACIFLFEIAQIVMCCLLLNAMLEILEREADKEETKNNHNK